MDLYVIFALTGNQGCIANQHLHSRHDDSICGPMLCVGFYLGPAASFEVASRVSRGVCNGTIDVDIDILLPLYFALLLVLV
jgi:hypothetical protein